MHKLLKEQLKKSSLKKSDPCLETTQFKILLGLIEATYEEAGLPYTSKKSSHTNTALLENIFNASTEGIIIQDSQHKVIRMNASMERILNISKRNHLGKSLDFFSEALPLKIKDEINRTLQIKGSWQGEVEIELYASKIIYIWLSFNLIKDKKNIVKNTIIRANDISKMYASKEKMEYLASYDTLTDIPNRALLFRQLKQSIASMERKQTEGMLLFIDIDHFKEINDNYGHQVGDQVLVAIAQEISSVCRIEDILGRLSGDEFLLISEDVKDQHAIHAILQKIQDIFNRPLKIDNLSLHITVSIGVALYPKNGNTPEVLINAADQAMYSVKKHGRDHFAFYSQEMSDIANEYFFIQNALKDAIRAANFTLVYQPQYSLTEHTITGIEVLLRCTHSRIKDISINRLITIAEETGLIHKISQLVLSMVCTQLYKWKLAGISVPPIAVNLSRKELDAKNLILTIHNTMSLYKLEPHEIELEITESALLQEGDIVSNNISRLQKLGHNFAIDDYGTGFSSLSNIKTFHFDKLKIDKSFIDNLAADKDDQVIVSATIAMAKDLGLRTIAEGVETKEQAQILKQFGCDIIQGYLYSKPLSKNDMQQLLVSV